VLPFAAFAEHILDRMSRPAVPAGESVTEIQPRKTPLYDIHVAARARMVEFAGWSMPVQYTGILEEHRAVRDAAGIFDVSHMGEGSVRGPGALALLQRLTCNDVGRLKPGRAQYNALTTPGGAFVDDLIVYMLREDDYLLVLNAANAAKDLAWIREHLPASGVELTDVSERFALIAVQGPRSPEILQPLTDAELSKLRYFRLVEADVVDSPCIIARTGYTGEDGFEIFAPPAAAPRIWAALARGGGPLGLRPAGLAARDTLRLEAKMTLYGNDIDETTTVLEADLGWIVKLEKGEFVGREVLERQARDGVSRKLVGFEMDGRAIARHGYSAIHNGEVVGQVTSGSHSPTLGKNIGLVYLPRGMWEPGTTFEIEIRKRRESATVVPTPFYKRPR
jgi:aminomethyltransferase